jgi:hypothetical protein
MPAMARLRRKNTDTTMALGGHKTAITRHREGEPQGQASVACTTAGSGATRSQASIDQPQALAKHGVESAPKDILARDAARQDICAYQPLAESEVKVYRVKRT